MSNLATYTTQELEDEVSRRKLERDWPMATAAGLDLFRLSPEDAQYIVGYFRGMRARVANITDGANGICSQSLIPASRIDISFYVETGVKK